MLYHLTLASVFGACHAAGSSRAVARWSIEEVWWRETPSQGRSCTIVSFFYHCFTYHEWIYSSMWVPVLYCYLIQLPSLWASLRQKAQLCHGFVMLPQGQNKKGESEDNDASRYLLIMTNWLLYMHHSNKGLPSSIPWWTKISILSQTGRRWQELYSNTFKYIFQQSIPGLKLYITYFMYSDTGWNRRACYCSPGLVGLSSWLGRSCLQTASKPGWAIQFSSGNLWSKVSPLSKPINPSLDIVCAWYFRSQTKQEIAPPSHVVERYIELLCRYQPEAVYNFLKINNNYRLEEALEVSTSNLMVCTR